MNHERLAHLRNHVLAEDRRRDLTLHMSVWFQCGSVACALGLAGLDPKFRREGLRAHLSPPVPSNAGRRAFDGMGRVTYESLSGVKYSGHKAAAWFFDLSYRDAEEIFSPATYGIPPHKIVRANVRDAIDDVIAAARRTKATRDG